MRIGDVWWDIRYVSPHDKRLMRSDGSYSVGVTDSVEQTIYISDMLSGKFLEKVMCHEIVHAYIFSYGIYIPLEEEERIADFVASYGKDIMDITDSVIAEIRRRYA